MSGCFRKALNNVMKKGGKGKPSKGKAPAKKSGKKC